MFVPNFMKIKRGEGFFVDLVWNDPCDDLVVQVTGIYL